MISALGAPVTLGVALIFLSLAPPFPLSLPGFVSSLTPLGRGWWEPLVILTGNLGDGAGTWIEVPALASPLTGRPYSPQRPLLHVFMCHGGGFEA